VKLWLSFRIRCFRHIQKFGHVGSISIAHTFYHFLSLNFKLTYYHNFEVLDT